MEKNTLLWACLDVPPAPEYMIQEALDLVDYDQHSSVCMNSDYGDNYKYRNLYKDGAVYKSGFNNCRYLSQVAYKWVLDNIDWYAKDIRVSFTLPGLERCGPHIDGTRDYTLIYVIQSGGPDHETVFWREKGTNELVRPLRYTVDDYNQVERIDGIKIPEKTWILLNSRVLHSVENIKQGRVSLQIAFDDVKNLKFSKAVYAG